MIKIALVDDHQMLRNGLAEMLANRGFEIVFEASNGKECIEKLDIHNLPRIILMDINMPIMNGYETTKWLYQNYPAIKVLALSMYDTEENIIRMLRCGACGYMLKDSDSAALVDALQTINFKGFYTNELLNAKIINAVQKNEVSELEFNSNVQKLTPREKEFLHLCCSEMTYKQIAFAMNISVRTVDSYRENLFSKLQVQSRTALIIHAIKHKILE